MSIAKIHHVNSAQKEHECESCRQPITKGSPYIWFEVGFRARLTHKRHVDCPAPRRSELESSRFAEAYAAAENAEASIAAADSTDDIRSALDECAQDWNDLASEYDEASTDDNGNVFNTDAEERACSLEDSASELESWEPNETEEDWHCDEHDGPDEECDECEEQANLGMQAARDEALEHLQSSEQF